LHAGGRVIVILTAFVFCFRIPKLNSLGYFLSLFSTSFYSLGMAQLAFSFCLAVPDTCQVRDVEDSFRDLRNACNTFASQKPHITAQFTNEFFVKANPTLSKHISACNITLTGPAPAVISARGELLRDNPAKVI
jgi:hypothetical protein